MTIISHHIKPKAKDLGGFPVKRALPYMKQKSVGPFIFWDEMGPAHFNKGESLNVLPHPHIGLATVSYLFKGAMLHRDSLGTIQEIYPRDVNLMTAGSGIVHSERGVDKLMENAYDFHGIQTWLALPKEQEEMNPAFQHIARKELPFFKEEGFEARLIMGTWQKKTSPVKTAGNPFYMEVKIKKGARFQLNQTIEELGLYIVKG